MRLNKTIIDDFQKSERKIFKSLFFSIDSEIQAFNGIYGKLKQIKDIYSDDKKLRISTYRPVMAS